MALKITAFDLAQRFIGIKEISGNMANPQILAMLKLDDEWPKDDAVPWCSAFVNYIAWLLRLPRSKKLNARSWLEIGRPIDISQAKAGFDIAVFKRGDDGVSGHVGFYAGLEENTVYVLGGNQSDSVNITCYTKDKLLGVRRIYEDV
jgi:uncharacterized protein (TIGR02594 family)